eukprot:757352-Hanusia_phi.AAC.4
MPSTADDARMPLDLLSGHCRRRRNKASHQGESLPLGCPRNLIVDLLHLELVFLHVLLVGYGFDFFPVLLNEGCEVEHERYSCSHETDGSKQKEDRVERWPDAIGICRSLVHTSSRHDGEGDRYDGSQSTDLHLQH